MLRGFVSRVRRSALGAVLGALLAAIALCADLSAFSPDAQGVNTLLQRFALALSGSPVNAGACFALALLPFLAAGRRGAYRFASARVCAALMAAGMVVGASYRVLGDWGLLGGRYAPFALLLAAGYYRLFSALLSLAFDAMDAREAPRDGRVRRGAWACALFACWLPWLLVFYPGSVTFDAFRQLDIYFGVLPWSSAHPPLTSVAMGLFVSLGRWIGSENAGIFLYVLAQSALSAFLFADAVTRVHRLRPNLRAARIALLFFAFMPLWAGYMQSVLKDTLYTAVFASFCALAFECREEPSARRYVRLGVVALLLCLIRGNGVAVAAVTLALMALSRRNARRGMAALCLAGVIGVYALYSALLLPALGVSKPDHRDQLSIPFQQTARYLKDYPDDVTDSEHEAVDAVLDVDAIAELYQPDISDPVKRTYREGAGWAELGRYFGAWASMGARHPDAYLNAFLAQSAGYFDPNTSAPVGPIQYFLAGRLDNGEDAFSIEPPKALEKARGLARALLSAEEALPVVGLLYAPAFYVWLVMALTAYMLHRRRGRELWVFAPAYATILMCLASPVNAYVRYMLPVMACAPLLMQWTLGNARN